MDQLPKNFTLLSLESVNATLCPEHGDLQEKIILYCLQCDQPVCSTCVTNSHNGHSFKKIGDQFSEIKKTTRDRLAEFKKQYTRELEMMTSYERQITQCNDFCQKSLTDIDSIFIAQSSALERRKVELK
jgi:hypothetical protein